MTAYASNDLDSLLDSTLSTINGIGPLMTPFSYPNWPWVIDSRADVFEEWTPIRDAGTGINLFAEYLPSCWIESAIPETLNKVSWLDTSSTSYRYARGVAITARHVIVSEHAGGPAGPDIARSLVWAGFTDYAERPADTVVRKVVNTLYNIRADGIQGGANGRWDSSAVASFRMYYLDSDLPAAAVCRLINPDDIVTGFPNYWSWQQKPFIIFDKQHRATIQCNKNTSLGGAESKPNIPAHADCRTTFIRPAHTSFGTVSAAATLRDKLFVPLDSGNSGSPVFAMHESGELLWFGHMTTSGQTPQSPNNTASCLTYLMKYGNLYPLRDQLFLACHLLNRQSAGAYGGDPTLVPTYYE